MIARHPGGVKDDPVTFINKGSTRYAHLAGAEPDRAEPGQNKKPGLYYSRALRLPIRSDATEPTQSLFQAA
jgi:hypothetical protein